MFLRRFLYCSDSTASANSRLATVSTSVTWRFGTGVCSRVSFCHVTFLGFDTVTFRPGVKVCPTYVTVTLSNRYMRKSLYCLLSYFSCGCQAIGRLYIIYLKHEVGIMFVIYLISYMWSQFFIYLISHKQSVKIFLFFLYSLYIRPGAIGLGCGPFKHR